MITITHYKHVFLNPSETFIRNQIKSISRQNPGFKSIALCRELKTGADQCPGLSEIIRIPKVDVKLHKALRVMPVSAVKLCRRKTDLIHAHFGKNGWRGVALAKAIGVPLVVSFYGRDASAVPASPTWLRKYRSLFRNCARVLVLSEHMKQLLIKTGCPEHLISIHHFGVDTASLPFTPSLRAGTNRIKLLLVGRFTAKKGIPTALRALTALPGSELSLVGDGETRGSIIQEARELGVADRVVLKGWLDSHGVRREMQTADILLVPSETAPDGDMEGTPTVIFEAMASGTPVIGSTHAGIPEQIVDGESGYLVGEGDHSAVARAAEALMKSREHYFSIAERARARVIRLFDSDTQAAALARKYRQILQKT